MQKLIQTQLHNEGEGLHIHQSDGVVSPHGCVFTDIGPFISKRYEGIHGAEYAKVSLQHEDLLRKRIRLLTQALPGMFNMCHVLIIF